MAWIDKINNDIIITTGDGVEYRPLYSFSPIQTDFNISEFNFPNVAGTKVVKWEPIGRKFTLEIFFQGEENIDVAETFMISSNDRRPWKIIHPQYGTINCHPSSIVRDSSLLNVTKMTITLLETLLDDSPKTSINPVASTTNAVESFNDDQSLQFETVEFETSDLNDMSNQTDTSYQISASNVSSGDESDEYFNRFNTAKSKILNAGTDAVAAVTAIKSMLVYPAYFSESVQYRLNLLLQTLLSFQSDLINITTVNQKQLFEMNTTTIVSAMVQTVVTPLDQNDYGNSDDVLSVIETLSNSYNSVVENLDSLQTPNGGDENSYIPNSVTLNQLTDVVNYSISQLMTIALNAKQERVFICDEDTNIVLLAHRFYGLVPDDSTIDDLIRTNQIGINEMLLIKKNRTIKYYV